MRKAAAPVDAAIGTHLASLNLFREPDGTLYITVAGATGALVEFDRGKAGTHQRPIDYVEDLVCQAAYRMQVRRKTAK